MSRWSLAASWPVLVVGLLVVVAAVTIFLVHVRRSGGRRAVIGLEGLRLLIIALLVFTLLRPEYVHPLARTEAPVVAVLLDASGSMDTRDVVVSNQVLTRAEWIATQRAAPPWQPLAQAGRIVVEEFAAPPDPTNAAARAAAGTDLNLALESVLRRERNLKAVLLLTDGDWNQGQSPVVAATRYREQNVPVYAVAVGRETPLPDLILESISAPAYGLFGEQIVLPFRVRSYLPREVRTTVSLFDPNGDEVQRELIVPPLGEAQELLLWSPRAVGEAELTVRLPVETDELLPENNERAVRIHVRQEQLRVLVVDSLPRWEYRFLRNAIERDPGVEGHYLLLHPGLSPGGGRNYLRAFPDGKEAISRYDVIFLGDVGIGDNELRATDAELIRGLVEQQASGLVLLPGPRGRQLTLRDSALGELFPVLLDPAKPEGFGRQNPASLLLTTAGKRHWLTRLDADEQRNEELWKLLPGFYWSAAVEKSRPGAEVLAVHSELRNEWGRLPLLVTRPAGQGKVLFMGSDSAWRWRRGVEDKYHYRFWSQIVRWMAHQRHLAAGEGLRLSYSPESPQVGDTIFLQATVLDAGGSPLSAGEVVGKIIPASGRAESVVFTPVPGGWGVFTASVVAEVGGPHQLEVMATAQGRKLEARVDVTQPERERRGRPVNWEMLREVAAITRGAAVSYEALPEVVRQIALLPEPKPAELRLRLWSHPAWGAGLLSLLVVYWIGRKLAGLI